MTVADVNADGIPDLVAGGANQMGFSTLLGDGKGGFRAPIVTRSSEERIALADFNGDGFPDVALGAYYVRLGNGDGTFGPYISVTQVPGIKWVSTADIDGDGAVDIVGAGFAGVSVARGRGDGTFDPPDFLSIPGTLSHLALADVNGDGQTDLILSCSAPNQILVLLGTGAGSFAAPIATPVDGTPSFAAPADLDGDGRADLVVLAGESVTSLLGFGTGRFRVADANAAGPTVSSLAAGDVNGDGIPDVAVGGYAEGVSILFGLGGGRLSSPTPIRPSVPLLEGLALADVTEDGLLDLVVIGTGDVVVVKGNGDGSFRSPLELDPPELALNPLPWELVHAIADFDRDGNLDVASLGSTGRGVVLLGDGRGGFRDRVGLDVGDLPQNVQLDSRLFAADLNGDGKPDLVLTRFDGGLRILLGNGDGTFGRPLSTTGETLLRALVVDLDGDGRPSLLYGTLDHHLRLRRGDGVGGFGPPATIAPFSEDFAVADLNGDKRLDIVAGMGDEEAVTYLADGHGGFARSASIEIAIYSFSLALGDVDGDGKVDLVFLNRYGFWVARGDGTGRFTLGSHYQLDSREHLLQVADVDGDGLGDVLLVDNSFTATLIVRPGLGGGRLGPSIRFATSEYPSASLADLDHDGKLDLIASHSRSGSISVLRNTTGEPTRLVVSRQPLGCLTDVGPLARQPEVRVYGDGDDVVSGALSVHVSLDVGPPGASLTGHLEAPAIDGVAAFTSLGVDRKGTYRLSFTSVQTRKTLSTRFATAPPALAISGPVAQCANGVGSLAATAGLSSYSWSLDGGRSISSQPAVRLSGLTPGVHTIRVAATLDGCSASASRSITVPALPDPSIDVARTVVAGSTGNIARVSDAGAGALYAWHATNATITGGSGSFAVTFTAGPVGTVGLEVTISRDGCATSSSATTSAFPEPCVHGDSLCLLGGRFLARVDWIDPYGGTRGAGVPEAITRESGSFWFFSKTNLELVVKVLDGRAVNGAFWVLYGALTDVEYTITVSDAETGAVKTYHNAPKHLGGAIDTAAFPSSGSASAVENGSVVEAPLRRDALSTCADSHLQLCLGDRFGADVSWENPHGYPYTGNGTGVALTSSTGYFWFFGSGSVELVVKVLDGRTVNGHYWVLYGSLTDVHFVLSVYDLQTGRRQQYHNSPRVPGSGIDILAF